jgi:hypothetical protein
MKRVLIRVPTGERRLARMAMPPNTQDAAIDTIMIRDRWSGEVIYGGAHAATLNAVEAAVCARVNLASAKLASANLDGANLARANLASANLAGANLANANLARANLAGAYLAGANLAGAYLADANLAGANLAGAYLAGANLAGANLDGANLARANLAGANLADANLADANLAGAKFQTRTRALVTLRRVMQVTSIGSRTATLTIYSSDQGLLVQTGCFGPAPVAEFEAAVSGTHGDNYHGRAYRAALDMARIAMDGA